MQSLKKKGSIWEMKKATTPPPPLHELSIPNTVKLIHQIEIIINMRWIERLRLL
jgi:hypothetical protein